MVGVKLGVDVDLLELGIYYEESDGFWLVCLLCDGKEDIVIVFYVYCEL